MKHNPASSRMHHRPRGLDKNAAGTTHDRNHSRVTVSARYDSKPCTRPGGQQPGQTERKVNGGAKQPCNLANFPNPRPTATSGGVLGTKS